MVLLPVKLPVLLPAVLPELDEPSFPSMRSVEENEGSHGETTVRVVEVMTAQNTRETTE